MTRRIPVTAGGESPAFPDGLPLTRPTIEDPAAVARDLESVLASGMMTNGPRVRELEAILAERLEVPHVVAVSNCTAGLMLVWQALSVRGRVIMPSFTFSASAHAVAWAGGTPEFTDVDRHTINLDPARVAESVAGSVAICATHVYGTPADTAALQAIADSTRIPVVYDAAHGLGSRHDGRPIGGFGAAEVFSMSPTKVVVAGEGGIVATRRADLAEAVRIGRDYGNPGNYDCRFAGLNARMSELHAVTAIHSLKHLDERIEHRRELARAFRASTAGVAGLRYPQTAPGDVSTFKDLTLIIDGFGFGLTASQLAVALRAEGIDSRHYYSPPIHRQRAYAHLRSRALPVTDLLADQVISIPLWSHMEELTVRRLADTVVAIHEHAAEVRRSLCVTPPIGQPSTGGAMRG
jgi:dTDP-4-amino-4,6-dideoxygalactose transaminase